MFSIPDHPKLWKVSQGVAWGGRSVAGDRPCCLLHGGMEDLHECE